MQFFRSNETKNVNLDVRLNSIVLLGNIKQLDGHYGSFRNSTTCLNVNHDNRCSHWRSRYNALNEVRLYILT